MRSPVLGLLVLSQLFTATPVFAQDALGRPRITPFMAPGRIFQVGVPSQWSAFLTDDPNTIEFVYPGGRDRAALFIRRFDLPRGASARQLAMNAVDNHLGKLPGFQTGGRRDTTIGGRRAAVIFGTYYHQGNMQYPRAVEEVYVVDGTDGYVFHFDCFRPLAGSLSQALNTFYSTFVPRPPGALTDPFATDHAPPPIVAEPDEYPELDKVPF